MTMLPGGANVVGQEIARIMARHSWTWAQTAAQLGTTPEYARKLVQKPVTEGAGKALLPNLAKFAVTGRAQTPVQRRQAVRVRGGGVAPAAPRSKPPTAQPSKLSVTRQAFAGGGTQVKVTLPRSGPNRIAGERAINDAIKDAVRTGRKIAFQLRLYDGTTRAAGSKSGYVAKSAQTIINLDDGRVLAWLAAELEDSTKYTGRAFTAGNIAEVSVIMLPERAADLTEAYEVHKPKPKKRKRKPGR